MTTNLRARRYGKWNLFLGGPLGLLIASTGTPAIATERTHATSDNAGSQAASWFVTVPYGAVKTAFAIGGGIVSGSRGQQLEETPRRPRLSGFLR